VVRSRVRPISADVVGLGGEGEHGHLQAIASLAHGETRGDTAWSETTSRAGSTIQVGGPGEVTQDASLRGDCQPREGVDAPLAAPSQDRLA
jgi:hypothetical protein